MFIREVVDQFNCSEDYIILLFLIHFIMFSRITVRTTSTMVPDAFTEDVVDDRDDHDFNVRELASMCQSLLLQQNYHSYA